jgi:hypothetical protein
MTTDPLAGFEEHDADGVADARQKLEAALVQGAAERLNLPQYNDDAAAFTAAVNTVVASGFFSAEHEHVTVTQAEHVIREAVRHFRPPRIELVHPEVGFVCEGAAKCLQSDHEELPEPGPMFHTEPQRIDGQEWLAWRLSAVRDIYGHLEPDSAGKGA